MFCLRGQATAEGKVNLNGNAVWLLMEVCAVSTDNSLFVRKKKAFIQKRKHFTNVLDMYV